MGLYITCLIIVAALKPGVAVFIAVAFIPTVVAKLRQHHNTLAISVFNGIGFTPPALLIIMIARHKAEFANINNVSDEWLLAVELGFAVFVIIWTMALVWSITAVKRSETVAG